MNIKKLVLTIMEKKLNELGYYFDTSLSLPTQFVFANGKIGFRTGLYLTRFKWNNTLIPSLKISPSDVKWDLFYIAGDNTGFEYDIKNYSSEEHFTNYLQIVLEQFVCEGHPWILNNSIKEFDVLQVYGEIIDKKLKQFQLERTYTDENIINGGKVVYEKDDFKLIFQHYKDMTKVNCLIEESGEQKLLSNVFGTETVKDMYKFPQFTQIDEYISILEKYISVIS